MLIILKVVDEVKKLKEGGKMVTKFSITGYSLGGLLSRYVIGYGLILYPHMSML